MSTKLRRKQVILYYVWINEEIEIEVPEDLTQDDIYNMNSHDMEDKYWEEIDHAQESSVDNLYKAWATLPGIIEQKYMESQETSWEVIDVDNAKG